MEVMAFNANAALHVVEAARVVLKNLPVKGHSAGNRVIVGRALSRNAMAKVPWVS